MFNRHRSVKVALAQIDVLPGRPVRNTETILAAVQRARQDGAQIVVFPEMAVPGYLLGDEWERAAFLRECERCGEQVRQAATDITIIFGSVGIDWERRNEDGRVRKYNALFVAHEQRLIGPPNSPYRFVIKTLLPNYREFDDSRHFFDVRKLALERELPLHAIAAPVRVGSLLIGGVLCEDGWDMDYCVSPLALMAQHHRPDFYVNISASPFTVNKNHKRNRVFSAQAARLGRPLVYVNKVGMQNNGKTVFTFDGSSCVYDGQGHQVTAAAPFEEAVRVVEIPLDEGIPFGDPVSLREDGIEMMGQALRYGTRRFMELCGVDRVVVGVSGGIDSAVVAALYARLLPPDQLLLLNMPSRYNSDTTRGLAAELARNLGCFYADVPIEDSVALTTRQLGRLEITSLDGLRRRRLTLSDFHLENVQARDRSSRVLAAAASAFGGVFTCNGNKSEMTVGYATLYGDMAGYLANLADLWKTEVYQLARHINGEWFDRPVIPQGSIDIVPSAELSDAQDVDRGLGDPLMYEYHDLLFKSWVEWWNRATPEDILEWYVAGELSVRLGYEGDLSSLFPSAADFVADLERWWALYTGMGLAKRIQAPPILAVKRRAFGFDHRESQMGVRYTTRYEQLKGNMLSGA